jgi:ABC-type multidrug transport system fused ATPase/permease subunit
MLLALLIAGADYALAAILVLFLFRHGLAEADRLPYWFESDVLAIPAFWFPLLLVAAGLVRALLVLCANQVGHAALEFVRLRLTLSHGYDLLLSEKQRAIPLSEINLRMSEYIARAPDFVYNACEGAAYVVRAAGLGIVLALIAWRVTLVGTLAFGAAGVVAILLSRRLARLSFAIPAKRTAIERLMVRVSQNWVFIRVSNLCRREHAAFSEAALEYFACSVKLLFHRNLLTALPPFLGTVGVLFTVYVGVAVFDTPPVILAGFLYLFLRFAQAVSRSVDHLGALGHHRAQFRGAMAILDGVPPEAAPEAFRAEDRAGLMAVRPIHPAPARAAGEGGGAEAGQDGPADVEMRNVTFAWAGMVRPVLEGLSLQVPAGGMLGIAGPNGSGKSTLLGVMVGVLRPQRGDVLISGRDAHDFAVETNRIGYVTTAPYLVQGTVRDNLLYGAPRDVTEGDVWEALRSVGMEEVVRALPGGLGYTIDEDQSGLSSGQSQRLSLARALLRRPLLLVLDEATANMDLAAERQVARLLRSMHGRCTVVVASHNEAMLEGADARLDLPGRD